SGAKNKEGRGQEIKQESTACRRHRGAVRSRACWRVLRSGEESKAGITGGLNSRKEHSRATFRKSERGKGQCLLCQRNPGRDSDALIEDCRSEGDLAHIHAALQKCT